MTLTLESQLAPEVILDAIHRAAESVFSTMLGITIEPQPASGHPEPELLDGVVGLIGFTGRWAGAGMLLCEDRFACHIGSAMLMQECAEVNADVLDGIGEMANMILGNFKECLESRIGPLSLSVPTVVYGQNFAAHTPIQAPWIVAPFRAGPHRFQVRVCMKLTSADASSGSIHPAGNS